MFYFLCKDLYPTVFSFLLYTESITLQKCSKSSLKEKEKMDKYCQHIHPHGTIETYYTKTKNIQKREKYKEGKLEGIQREWYENGQLLYKTCYKYLPGGEKYKENSGIYSNYNMYYNMYNGTYNIKKWFKNGQLAYENNYNYKGIHGIQYGYNETGILLYCNIFKNGKVIKRVVNMWWCEQ